MPYEIATDRDARILRVRYTGEVSLQERLVAAREVIDVASSSDFQGLLLDFRAAQSLGSDRDAIARIVDECMPQLPANGRVAYLVRYDHQVDDTLEVLARSRGFHVDRFRDIQAAMAWLRDAGVPEAPPADERDAPHALRLVGELTDPANPLTTDQVAALGDLVHALVAAGMDDATVRRVAGRIATVMRPARSR